MEEIDGFGAIRDAEAQFAKVGIIVPTRNESENVVKLVSRLAPALESLGCSWQVLFVDDSDDDTPDNVRHLARKGWPAKVLHRPRGFRTGGLSGAVVSGIANTEAEFLLVMDADLQHPPEVVVDLLRPLLDGHAEISVATRYSAGGAGGGLDGPWRKFVSKGSRVLTRVVFKEVRDISDPCGGFFAFNRSVVEGVHLQPGGFKILMEILVRGNWTVSHEVPYLFASRLHGASKTSMKEGLAFLGHMRRLRMTAPARSASSPSQSALGSQNQPPDRVIDVTDPTLVPAVAVGTSGDPMAEAGLRSGVPFWVLAAILRLRPGMSLHAGSRN